MKYGGYRWGGINVSGISICHKNNGGSTFSDGAHEPAHHINLWGSGVCVFVVGIEAEVEKKMGG